MSVQSKEGTPLFTTLLPDEFKSRMQETLGAEFDNFLASYEKPYRSALRINNLKCYSNHALSVIGQAGTALTPVPWTAHGYYYDESSRPGKSPLHEAGLYYIQEPSAMIVAERADVRPSEKVLDLCAAPGGKTTALADCLAGEGLLVANEIHPARVKILSQNVERMGIKNCIVTNASPNELSARFFEFFDCIVVDAPCSGEGMFRKEPDALKCWSLDNIELCKNRQRDILVEAEKMLAPGGRLIYSTCTFAPEEDEEQIASFLETYPAFELVSQEKMWPHKLDGEGHFVAVLTKAGRGDGVSKSVSTEQTPIACQATGSTTLQASQEKTRKVGKSRRASSSTSASAKADHEAIKLYEEFAGSFLVNKPDGSYISYGDNLYMMPADILLDGLKCLRPGLQLGETSKGRFTPSHALALSLKPGDAKASLDLTLEEGARYIAGESLSLGLIKSMDENTEGGDILRENAPSERRTASPASDISHDYSGWVLVTVCGISLGFGKVNNGMLKNHYPKGLRKQ